MNKKLNKPSTLLSHLLFLSVSSERLQSSVGYQLISLVMTTYALLDSLLRRNISAKILFSDGFETVAVIRET